MGKGIELAFPIIIEGKGTIKLGNHSILGKNIRLGIGEKANLEIGDRVRIETRSIILLRKEKTFSIGDGFKLGEGARLYVQQDWEFGNEVKIETYTAIFSREKGYSGCLKIGDGTHIGDYTIIDVSDNISIGKEVAIGPNCTLYTHDHEYTNKESAAWKGGIHSSPIIIEDGVWIGANVTILAGVVVGKKAVVAAGAVVTKNVQPESLVGGVPAKKIKVL